MIGVGSVERGVGTTCVCLSFATFLHSKLGMKTAYIELNTTDQIRSLSKKNSLEPFIHQGIHIYPSTKVTSLSEILNKDFDYVILDMGVLTNYTAIEFSKCQKQFLVCDFCQWKTKIQLERIKNLTQNKKIQQKGIVFLSVKNESTYQTLTNNTWKTFPFITNPFQLTVTVFHALNLLLV